MSRSKFLSRNDFGGHLEGPILILGLNCFSSKSFQNAFLSKQMNILAECSQKFDMIIDVVPNNSTVLWRMLASAVTSTIRLCKRQGHVLILFLLLLLLVKYYNRICKCRYLLGEATPLRHLLWHCLMNRAGWSYTCDVSGYLDVWQR